jgi:hypothetical protein
LSDNTQNDGQDCIPSNIVFRFFETGDDAKCKKNIRILYSKKLHRWGDKQSRQDCTNGERGLVEILLQHLGGFWGGVTQTQFKISLQTIE